MDACETPGRLRAAGRSRVLHRSSGRPSQALQGRLSQPDHRKPPPLQLHHRPDIHGRPAVGRRLYILQVSHCGLIVPSATPLV